MGDFWTHLAPQLGGWGVNKQENKTNPSMNNFIKIALRNLTRKPIYSIITFTGFTLSIEASLLIYLWVYNELSYEKFHPDYPRIYRVLTLSKQGDKIVKSPYGLRTGTKNHENGLSSD